MGEFSVWHLLILAAVFVIFFGSKKLPDAARSFGRSLRILKAETRGLHDDDASADKATAPAVAVPGAAPVPPAAAIPPAPAPQPGIVAEGAVPVTAPVTAPVRTPAADAR